MAQDFNLDNLSEGSPFPRGASFDGQDVNFALFSAHATKVELCLFDESGEREIARIGADGEELLAGQWEDSDMRCFGVVLDGRAQPSGLVKPGEDATLFLILNAWHEDIGFKCPQVSSDQAWHRLIDTNVPDELHLPSFTDDQIVEVKGRSLQLLVLGPLDDEQWKKSFNTRINQAT